ncbi:MAG TPA: hypothetical protein VM076_16205 [Gemmatimonadaceae bacterium]|nr:hypothetical protein [Gemmatimonadaceae bacterium]
MASPLQKFLKPAALSSFIVFVGCRDDSTPANPHEPRRVASVEQYLPGSSADVPRASLARAPSYSIMQAPIASALVSVAATPVIRVYQDEQPWFGLNRAHTTILSLGKVLNSDYFIHPLAALASPIPAGTAVVVITSNSNGTAAEALAQNSPAAQSNLAAFVNAGGTLVVDMGDNLLSGGFRAPGAVGTPNYEFPNPCQDATLLPGTATHPIVMGPDDQPNTADDLTNDNIDAGCYVAHGNLEEGLTLPGNARRLMTASFASGARAITADYVLGSGCVILDTNTKEFAGQQPVGSGPTVFMRNLFSAAMRGLGCALTVGIDVKPGSETNPINIGANGKLPVAVLTTPAFNAATLNVATVTLGNEIGDETPVVVKNNGTRQASLEDVDGDGDVDLVLHFDVQTLLANGDLTPATTQLVLRGRTNAGVPVRGADGVTVVP